jgi:nucleotide-binding universal stress UspA family protein
MKIIVAYDGSEASQRALEFAVNQAKSCEAALIIAYVLEWSPYTFLTATEHEERHKRRQEELERAETAVIKPVLDDLGDIGVPVETVIRYGHIADTLNDVASSAGASLIVVGRNGQRGLSGRLFGSVAGTLAQSAPVPCTIVP